MYTSDDAIADFRKTLNVLYKHDTIKNGTKVISQLKKVQRMWRIFSKIQLWLWQHKLLAKQNQSHKHILTSYYTC